MPATLEFPSVEMLSRLKPLAAYGSLCNLSVSLIIRLDSAMGNRRTLLLRRYADYVIAYTARLFNLSLDGDIVVVQSNTWL